MLMEDYKEFVSKELVLSCFYDWIDSHGYMRSADEDVTYKKIESLPSVKLEPLTDKEQRIFLSSMAREDTSGYTATQCQLLTILLFWLRF